MPLRHVAIAVLVTAIWGFNFVVIRLGLGTMPPLLLAALRFVVAALPVLILARPQVPLAKMLAIGLTLFVGQFAFLFPAMKLGMPPGLASVTLQSQAFITILIVSALGERPSPRQIVGVLVAAGGLVVIATTVGGDFTWIGLGLTLASATSWAVGNVFMRTLGKVDMFPLVIWLCLIPILPLFGLSLALEGWPAIEQALTHLTPMAVASVLYLAIPTTIFGFGVWGFLLNRYPATTVAPFSLLVPLFGAGSAYLVLGEEFSGRRIVGMAMILAGLAVIVLRRPRRAA